MHPVWLVDLDNTLLAGDSDFEWTQFLIDKGVLDKSFEKTMYVTFLASAFRSMAMPRIICSP